MPLNGSPLPPPDPAARITVPRPVSPRRRVSHTRSKQAVAAGAVAASGLLVGWFAATSTAATGGSSPTSPNGGPVVASHDGEDDGSVSSGRDASRSAAVPATPSRRSVTASHGS
jgi:hypothetical protein